MKKTPLEAFIQLNGVNNDKKTALLLTQVSQEIFAEIPAICKNEQPLTLGYEALKDKLEKHYNPKLNKQLQRFAFRDHTQGIRESIQDFTTALRKLARKCEFSATEINSQLKDQLRCSKITSEVWVIESASRRFARRDDSNSKNGGISRHEGCGARDAEDREYSTESENQASIGGYHWDTCYTIEAFWSSTLWKGTCQRARITEKTRNTRRKRKTLSPRRSRRTSREGTYLLLLRESQTHQTRVFVAK